MPHPGQSILVISLDMQIVGPESNTLGGNISRTKGIKTTKTLNRVFVVLRN